MALIERDKLTNRTRESERPPCIYVHLTYDKSDPVVTGERMLFSINDTGSVGYPFKEKNCFVPLPHTTYKYQLQLDCRSKHESYRNKAFREKWDYIFVILE